MHQTQALDAYEREDLAAEGISEAEFQHANDLVPADSCQDSCHLVLANCDSQDKLNTNFMASRRPRCVLMCWSWPALQCRTLCTT